MTIITMPTTISAKIVTTLMMENQNSSSPKSLALNKLSDIKINTQNRALIQLGISGNQKLTYLATAVTAAITGIIQHNQYIRPVTNPTNETQNRLVTSDKDLKIVFVTIISPKPRININNINAIMIYVSKIEGPVNAMV